MRSLLTMVTSFFGQCVEVGNRLGRYLDPGRLLNDGSYLLVGLAFLA